MEIKIPQLGEGLQEARILRFLKQPGDPVAQDEPIFEMETDKAVMEIEAPVAGVLEAWTAHEDDVLLIGTVIGSIAERGESRVESRETRDEPAHARTGEEAGAQSREEGRDEGPSSITPMEEPAAGTDGRTIGVPPDLPLPRLDNALVPPRTRAYARAKGLSDAEIARLALTSDGKLLPEAVDRYVEAGRRGEGEKGRQGDGESRVESREAQRPTPNAQRLTPNAPIVGYEDVPLPTPQRTLAYRLQRGTQAVVPATLEMPVEWSAVEEVRARWRGRTGGDAGREPTQFLLFAWCVAQAVKDHARFRCALLNEMTLRQYAHLHLGIAVARPDDELLMARVPDADALAFEAFIAAAQEAIARARGGEDQASEAMQLSLTNLAATGARWGIPVVAAPAVGTLFIGAAGDEAYPLPGGGIGFRRIAHMVLTFDHRLVNGADAAGFLASVRARVERLREEFPTT